MNIDYAVAIANHLLQIKAIKLSPSEPFTWSSGLLSPIYCDNRITLSFPEVRQVIKEGFVDLLSKMDNYDAIVGIATAGIPHGMLVADVVGKPFCYVRSKPKEHGRQNRLEGWLKPSSKCILIEDLISTGGSSLSALEYLKESGHEASQILSIFSYGLEIATDNFSKYNASYTALCNFDTLIKCAVEQGYINTQEKKQLIEWQKDPKSWSESLIKS